MIGGGSRGLASPLWESPEPAPPPRGDVPPPGVCHLWCTGTEGDRSGWTRWLDADDTAHVLRHRVAGDRSSATASRGLQRMVAAHYLDVPPEQVRIHRRCPDCGSPFHGVPAVEGMTGLRYSVSHSGSWVVLAVVGSGLVGFDTEVSDPAAYPEDLAEAVLTPQEYAAYRGLPPAARAGWLCRAWVRKEAVLKATGEGLRVDPQRIDVRRDPAGVPAQAPTPAWGRGSEPVPAPGRLGLRDVAAPAGYAAALACSTAIAAVRSYLVVSP